jgi:HEAT repeat protein/beta-lactamase regulating signal transducer with metallopeptidase domain
MTPLSFDAWVELSLKGTMVLGAAATTCWAMWRASAATRHLVWAAAVSALLALPALSLVAPALTLPVSLERLQPASRVALPLVHTIVAERGVHAASAPAAPTQAPQGTAPAVTRLRANQSATQSAAYQGEVSTTAIVVAVWVFGAIALLVRLVTALISVRRMVATAETVDDETWHEELETAAADLAITRLPVLLWSAALSVPMTCGVTRPAILLPCAALHWDRARMRVVLLHELAHIRRRDCLVHCVAQAALALHWCNPLMWLALARLRAERERACDDLVLVAGTLGSDYAEHLLDIARQFRRQGMGVAAVAMARPSELEGRLLAILDPLRSRRPADRARLGWAIAAAALIVLPVSGLRLQARAVVPDEMQASAPTPTPTPTAPAPMPMPTPAPTPSPAGGRHAPGGVQPRQQQQRAQASQGAGKGNAPVVAGARTGQDDDEGDDDQPDAISDTARAQAAQALAAALKDENAEVRAQAMQALAQMKSPLAFEPIVAALKDASPEVRHQAAFSLGQMRDPRAVAPLSAALSDTDAEVRQQAVFALGQLRAKEAVQGLAAALKDTDPEVRQQAAFALGQVGDPSAIQPLVGALKDTNDEVREQAAFALGQVGDKAVVPGLLQALTDAKPGVRQQAAFALSQVGDASAVDALTTAMMKDADPDVRQQAAFALGQVFGRGGHPRERERNREK